MDELLNEYDQYKILLLTLFNLYDNSSLSIAYLQEYFGISKYKLNNILQELISELPDDVSIFKTLNINADADTVMWNEVTNNYIQFKRIQYINQSEKFELFQYIFLYDKKISEFIEDNHVSRTKAYRIVGELNEILEEYNIHLDASRLKGTEFDIRNISYQIYYSFFSERDIPLDEDTLKYIDNFVYGISKTEMFTETQIQRTQLKKIKIFVGINHIRMKYGYFVDYKEKISEDGYLQVQKVFSELHKFVNTDYISGNDQERSYLYEFLRLNISRLELPTITENIDIEVLSVAKDFFDTLEANNLLEDADDTKLYKLILKLHERLRIFPWIPITFNMGRQSQFFEENYYIFHSIIVNFLNTNKFYKDKKMGVIEYNSIYYDLMFCLIDCLPLRLAHNEVRIYIDFSRGEIYTNYITKSVLAYQDLNLIVQDEYDSTTDIFLSDIDLSEVNCEKIIWKNPPSATDWKLFADKVLNVRKERVEQ